jgi:MtN3 and saliva related transmembrane protein
LEKFWPATKPHNIFRHGVFGTSQRRGLRSNGEHERVLRFIGQWVPENRCFSTRLCLPRFCVHCYSDPRIMKFDYITLIGLIAAICTTCSFLPQVIKILRSKKTKDVSFLMYAILSTGLFLWLIYGFILKDFPLILANSISLALSMCVLFLKIRHG